MNPGALQGLDLSGRVALVTGGSSGLGRAIAIVLAARGAAVAVNYHRGRERAEAAVAEIAAAGGKAMTVQADVTQRLAIAQMATAVAGGLGQPDILVNCAGDFLAIRPFLEIDEELWDDSIALNLKSAFLCSQVFLPGMLDQGWGRVIHLSSIVSHSGGAGETIHYAAPKGAIDTLTRGMAREFAARGVLVNAVCPGLIDTPIHDKYRERFERLAPGYAPVGRAGRPEEVAEVVAFLAAEAAGYITGQIIHVNGGRI